MYLYWGYSQKRNYVSVDNILKVMNFLKNFFFFLHFGSHTCMPKILILNFAHHTQTIQMYTNGHTQICMGTIFTFCTFCVTHAKNTNTSTDTDTYAYRYTQVHMQILQTYACLFTYTNTHADTCMHTHRCACGKSWEIVTWNPLLSQSWQNFYFITPDLLLS